MPKRDAAYMAAQRERILRAAILCIAEDGLKGTSIATICRQAGISAGALYVHFRNKDEIVEAAVRHGSHGVPAQIADWPSLKRHLASLDDHDGFDLVTVMRARLHLHAEIVRSGHTQSTYRPMIEHALDAAAAHLQRLHDHGAIGLLTGARQTAIDIAAYIDGIVWIGLATATPLDKMQRQLLDGLDRFVDPIPTPAVRAPRRQRRQADV